MGAPLGDGAPSGSAGLPPAPPHAPLCPAWAGTPRAGGFKCFLKGSECQEEEILSPDFPVRISKSAVRQLN